MIKNFFILCCVLCMHSSVFCSDLKESEASTSSPCKKADEDTKLDQGIEDDKAYGALFFFISLFFALKNT